jgi:methionyl-tRNA formyltransferase
MDEGLDTGDVLCAAPTAIDAECTSARLHDALAQIGAAQILRAIEGVANGTLVPQPQPAEGVTYAAKLSRAEARIDWQHDAAQIDRQVRAFNPWPTAETSLDAEPVKLWRSRVRARGVAADEPPGTLLGLAGDALEIACGSGVLQVMELQRAGRKAVAARDFLNGVDVQDGRAVVFQ